MQATPQDWCDRCARRIVEIDPELQGYGALRLARDVYEFERTRAMRPEEAADFVAAEMRREDLPRFERRTRSR